jgi:integrase
MVGVVRYVALETRTARLRLKPGPTFWRSLGGGLALGYSRRNGEPGVWKVRVYRGDERYRIATLTWADDRGEADGRTILAFEQASAAARAALSAATGAPQSVVTVADAVRRRVEWLRVHTRSADASERILAKLVLPKLGRIRLADLTTAMLDTWKNELAASPARVRTAAGQPQRFRPSTPRQRQSTTNRAWGAFRAALAMSFKEGHIASDVAWRRVERFRQADAAKPNWLSIAEGKRLIAAAEGNFKTLVQGALWTGMRYSELRNLNVADFADRTVYVKSQCFRNRFM